MVLQIKFSFYSVSHVCMILALSHTSITNGWNFQQNLLITIWFTVMTSIKSDMTPQLDFKYKTRNSVSYESIVWFNIIYINCDSIIHIIFIGFPSFILKSNAIGKILISIKVANDWSPPESNGNGNFFPVYIENSTRH